MSICRAAVSHHRSTMFGAVLWTLGSGDKLDITMQPVETFTRRPSPASCTSCALDWQDPCTGEARVVPWIWSVEYSQTIWSAAGSMIYDRRRPATSSSASRCWQSSCVVSPSRDSGGWCDLWGNLKTKAIVREICRWKNGQNLLKAKPVHSSSKLMLATDGFLAMFSWYRKL